MRGLAIAVLFSVYGYASDPSASRIRMFDRRDWKSPNVEHECVSLYAFRPGIHDSTSCLRVCPSPISPVHASATRYGIYSAPRIASAFPSSV